MVLMVKCFLFVIFCCAIISILMIEQNFAFKTVNPPYSLNVKRVERVGKRVKKVKLWTTHF